MRPINVIRWVSGVAAAGLFAVMAVVFLTLFDQSLLLPQKSLAPYSEQDLLLFAQALGPDLGFYRAIVLYVDSSLILAFVVWVFASYAGRGPLVWGAVFAMLPAVADFTENFMILARMGISPLFNVAPDMLLASPSPTYFVTLVKFALFLVSIVAVLRLARRAS